MIYFVSTLQFPTVTPACKLQCSWGITCIFSVCSFKDPVLGSADRKRELQKSKLVRSCVLHQAHYRHGFFLFLFLLLKAILIHSFQYPYWGLCFFADMTMRKLLFCRKMPSLHTYSLITLCILQQFCPRTNFLMCTLIFSESPNNLLGWLSMVFSFPAYTQEQTAWGYHLA